MYRLLNVTWVRKAYRFYKTKSREHEQKNEYKEEKLLHMSIKALQYKTKDWPFLWYVFSYYFIKL